MRSARLLFAALLLPGAAAAWPWSTDMMNQPSIKPQEGVNGQVMPFPKRSVPVGGIPTVVTNRDEAKSLQNPIPASAESIKEGRVLYRVYCAVCHGMTGNVDSPVAGKVGAIPLGEDYVQKQLTEGWLFGTITFGSYVMPAYGMASSERGGANDLSVEERWHVVNYLKHGLLEDNRAAATQAGAAK